MPDSAEFTTIHNAGVRLKDWLENEKCSSNVTPRLLTGILDVTIRDDGLVGWCVEVSGIFFV